MKFLYSNDNKRYHTYNYYLKQRYGQKVFRIPVDAGFTCPNRDDTLGIMGCSFCSIKGSGDLILRDTLEAQIIEGFQVMRNKWPNGLAQLYFQAYTNTYDSLANLKKFYEPYRFDERFVAVIIATRPDCLDDEKLDYFMEFNRDKELWIELGLQSIHKRTSDYTNRGHESEILFEMIKKCQQRKIKVAVHIINGLPYETKEMMIETAIALSKAKPDAIKIHMFHVLKNTLEAYRYRQLQYPLLSLEQYVDIVAEQLRHLPPQMIIMRLTGDGVFSDLIAPQWTKKKTIVVNEIDKLMAKNDWIQGDLYDPN